MARKKERYKWRACVLNMKLCSSAIIKVILETNIYKCGLSHWHGKADVRPSGRWLRLGRGLPVAHGCPGAEGVPAQIERGDMYCIIPCTIQSYDVLQTLAALLKDINFCVNIAHSCMHAHT